MPLDAPVGQIWFSQLKLFQVMLSARCTSRTDLVRFARAVSGNACCSMHRSDGSGSLRLSCFRKHMPLDAPVGRIWFVAPERFQKTRDARSTSRTSRSSVLRDRGGSILTRLTWIPQSASGITERRLPGSASGNAAAHLYTVQVSARRATSCIREHVTRS